MHRKISGFLKYLSFFLFMFIISASVFAQPDDAYIRKLTGDIDLLRLKKITEGAPLQELVWKNRSVHGFNNTHPDVRRQAVFSESWHILKNNKDEKNRSEAVQLPHQFENSRDYESAWYLNNVQVTKKKGKRYFLKLNRVEMFSLVYINGDCVGHHFGGLTPFEFEVSDVLKDGRNSLAILVYDKSASYDGNKIFNQMGITRLSRYNPDKSNYKLPGGMNDIPVLEERESNFLQDVFVKTSTRKGEMTIEYELPSKPFGAKSKLSFELFKWPNGEKVDLSIPEVIIPKNSKGIQQTKVEWSNADLWSPDSPNLYVLRTKLKSKGSRKTLCLNISSLRAQRGNLWEC